jgi:hypothetical protein
MSLTELNSDAHKVNGALNNLRVEHAGLCSLKCSKEGERCCSIARESVDFPID